MCIIAQEVCEFARSVLLLYAFLARIQPVVLMA